jgi:nicotinamide-nucleotide amidase
MPSPSVSSDRALLELARQVGEVLLGANQRLVTAESCTGGWIAKAVTDLAGSSRWFECGYVTYSNAAKVRDLGVSQATLDGNGAVSEPVVLEMAEGALRVSGADIAVAVSGIAGPDGGSATKPVGTVWFAVVTASKGGYSRVKVFPGDREAVRRLAVEEALRLVLAVASGRE